tara:strand:- start:168 stop:470 length:303 start_codon:yes stop_codon:yes gene_type:complete
LFNILLINIFSCSNDKRENERIVKEDWQEVYYRILNESSLTQGNDPENWADNTNPAHGLDSYSGRHNDYNIFTKKWRMLSAFYHIYSIIVLCLFYIFFRS